VINFFSIEISIIEEEISNLWKIKNYGNDRC